MKQEYVDYEIRRAIEWIGIEDQRGTKGDRQASYPPFFSLKNYNHLLTSQPPYLPHHHPFQFGCIILRELAMVVPTFYYQWMKTFFDSIFMSVRDPKPSVREQALYAIRYV